MNAKRSPLVSLQDSGDDVIEWNAAIVSLLEGANSWLVVFAEILTPCDFFSSDKLQIGSEHPRLSVESYMVVILSLRC